MKVLTWVGRRHPKARNIAAAAVEVLAATAAATAIAMVLPRNGAPPEVWWAILAAAFAAGAHYFAGQTARSPYAVFLPFLVVGVLSLRPTVTSRFSIAPAVGALVLGAILGALSYWNLRKNPGSKTEGSPPGA
jgi:hypothetical protein